MLNRYRHRDEPGNLLVLEIYTDKLPKEVREGCAPPGKPDTRLGARDDEEWREERRKLQEWRFPYTPWGAVTSVEEEWREAQPNMSLLDLPPLHT